jgi:Ser/Thr protein kinase RdoA (MazF antagonist)
MKSSSRGTVQPYWIGVCGPVEGGNRYLTRTATEAGLRRVLEGYALAGVSLLQRDERGFVNDNWIVGTAQGRFFLKHRHPNLCSLDIIQAQHDLINHLRQVGFPAPVLVRNAGGATLSVVEGECYEIQRYIEGMPCDPDRPEHLAEAAVALGRYHTLVREFVPAALACQGDLFHPSLARANLVRLRQAWEIPKEPELVHTTERLEGALDDLAARFDGHSSLPRVVIHGDYYAENLLFYGDRIVGIVDYDKACWQPRVLELATSLIYFASPRPARLTHVIYPGVLDWGLLRHFLHHYGHMVFPDKSEIQALPDYIACIWLQISLRCLLAKHPHRPAGAREALEEVLVLGDWASANASELRDLAESSVRSSYV